MGSLNEFPLKERKRMIEWLYTVKSALALEEKTIFLSIFLMDKYLLERWDPKQGYSKTFLYLLGIVCILLATKHEEVCPISVKLAYKDLGHCKFSEQMILDMELEVLISI